MGEERKRPGAAVRWFVWLAYAAAWTQALLMRNPIPSDILQQHPLPFFLFAKSVHVCAYALFAVLTGWLLLPLRWRCLLLAALGLHGAATEYLQHFVAGRNPSLRDVGLDLLGLVLGVALTWRLWRDG